MDTIEFIRDSIHGAYHQADDVMKDMTDALFNWVPAGTANPISAIFVHFLTSEDFFIQTLLRGMPQLWDEGDWSAKTGVVKIPGYGGEWAEFKHKTIAMEPVFEYQKVIRAATDSYLKTLTPVELVRRVNFAGEDQPTTTILGLLARHIVFHSGEIAALKGIQGSKGLPY
jgi:hypothetical protein